MKKLYLFNPDNDMALASGSPYYMAPSSAKKMAADLATLPVWYAEKGSKVWVSDNRQSEWMDSDCPLDLSIRGVVIPECDDCEFVAWGWSAALLHRLEMCGVKAVSSNADHLVSLRMLSSRLTSVELLPLLRTSGTVGESFWIISVDDILPFLDKYGKVLLKAPWSGSGKGIQPLMGALDDNLKGWAKRIISSQGGLVLEPYYNKVTDFAMEFLVEENEMSFVGYSLFETDVRGIYKENRLASDEWIERYLSEYVSLEILSEIRERLLVELKSKVLSDYQGYLGVDMMLVDTGGGVAVHPCVEVNLRMNMGVVSRLFFNRYVCSDACGKYVIEYYPRQGEALEAHRQMLSSYPLVLEKGRIRSGYLSLTPVYEDTNFQIYAML